MIPMIDLFTGIGAFSLAGKRNGNFNTIFCSENENYNVKFIERNLELDNCGNIEYAVVSEQNHPDKHMVDSDLVPVEETGFSPLCLADFFEGVLDFPKLVTGGFPCQDASPAYLQGGEGIKGEKTGLVKHQLRIMEDLEIEIGIFENSEKLNSRGLHSLLKELDGLGYCVEWETISATAWGYPHYRHRVFMVSYLKSSLIYKSNIRVMDYVRAQAQPKPKWRLPLLSSPEEVLARAVVENTRSIRLRTKRINSIGNSVIPDIPESIMNVISDTLGYSSKLDGIKPKTLKETPTLYLAQSGWVESIQSDMFRENSLPTNKMPRRGIMVDGVIKTSPKRCDILDPINKKYQGLYSTIILKDGNNNFTTRSRLNRPGKLGGLIGDIMKIGADVGGLHPEWCEEFMGMPKGYTELKY